MRLRLYSERKNWCVRPYESWPAKSQILKVRPAWSGVPVRGCQSEMSMPTVRVSKAVSYRPVSAQTTPRSRFAMLVFPAVPRPTSSSLSVIALPAASWRRS